MNKQVKVVEFFNRIPDDFLVNNTDISRYTNFESYIKSYDEEDWKILKQELMDNPTSSLKEIIDSLWVNYDNDIKLGEVYYHSSGFDEYVDCLTQWGKEIGLSEERIHKLCDELAVYVQSEWEKQHMTPEEHNVVVDDKVSEVVNNELIRNATFSSVWDDGTEVTTNCKVNLATREVFDIEVNDSNNIEKLNVLEREYITIDGEDYDVYNTELYDLENNNEDFWYGDEIEVKYPLLSDCSDYVYLLENLNVEALETLEKIINAYGEGKIDIEIVRDENDEIKIEESFNLIVNDKDYKETGLERVALKWYESFEDTGYLVDCFKDAYETNYYHFTVDYNENGEMKSFQINIGSNEKPDNQWVAQSISDYLSTHYEGSLEDALASIEGIDVLIENYYTGKYVDSDEVYGDDLQALLEHLKSDKPRLDAVISAAEQMQDNTLDNSVPSVEQER